MVKNAPLQSDNDFARNNAMTKTSTAKSPRSGAMKKRGGMYTVSDGTLVLTVESDGDGWLLVTCPLDPELVTQARNIDEAFLMAYDAKKLLDECRAELFAESKMQSAAAKLVKA